MLFTLEEFVKTLSIEKLLECRLIHPLIKDDIDCYINITQEKTENINRIDTRCTLPYFKRNYTIIINDRGCLESIDPMNRVEKTIRDALITGSKPQKTSIISDNNGVIEMRLLTYQDNIQDDTFNRLLNKNPTHTETVYYRITDRDTVKIFGPRCYRGITFSSLEMDGYIIITDDDIDINEHAMYPSPYGNMIYASIDYYNSKNGYVVQCGEDVEFDRDMIRDRYLRMCYDLFVNGTLDQYDNYE